MRRFRSGMAVFITLEDPTKPMIHDAKAAGKYRGEPMRWAPKATILS